MKHAENNLSTIQNQNVVAIIPARFESTRLQGKMLLPIAGKPLIIHTLTQAQKAVNVSRAIVATDDERILRAVEDEGGEAILTDKNHQSGSDRIAEIAANLPQNSIIVNVQGDEPLISPRTIERAVDEMLRDENADIVTTCEIIEDVKDVLNPNVVKVVIDANSYAIYFSRSPIPYTRNAANEFGNLENALKNDANLVSTFRKHTGLYVYRREFLLKFTSLPQSNLEKLESLEQLRAFDCGGRIKVIETHETSIGVDTIEDFKRVKMIIEKGI